jgi:hypothetical protein
MIILNNNLFVLVFLQVCNIKCEWEISCIPPIIQPHLHCPRLVACTYELMDIVPSLRKPSLDFQLQMTHISYPCMNVHPFQLLYKTSMSLLLFM